MKNYRRGNNEGSIYKRKNGTWRAMLFLDGKRLSFSSKSKNECQRWIREMLNQIDQGLTYDGATLTLKDYVSDWLVIKKTDLRFNTWKDYKRILEKRIIPRLGKYTLTDIKPAMIQSVYNNMIRKGVGFRQIQLTNAILRKALNDAIKQGLLTYNPTRGTTPPKPKKKEMKIYTPNEAQTLLLTAKTEFPELYPILFLALATGMRQGELLGLLWEDVDWEKGTLAISRQLASWNGTLVLDRPKTAKGLRTISLGPETVKILKDHFLGQVDHKKKIGSRWQLNMMPLPGEEEASELNFIFTSSIGTPLDRDKMRKRYKKLQAFAGVPKLRFHDLRHTAASYMLSNGIPSIIVSKRLGHEKVSTTLDIYGHLIPNQDQKAAEMIDQMLTPIVLDLDKLTGPR